MTSFNKDNQPQGKRGAQRAYRYGYTDVGEVCGRSGNACRQWFSRRGKSLDKSNPVESLRMVLEYAASVGVVGMRTIAAPAAKRAPELPERTVTEKTETTEAIVHPCTVNSATPLPEVKKRYAGEMNDKMASLLGAMGGAGVVGGVGVVEESDWERGRKAWMELAERVELGGGLDEDAEWGEYNSGVIKYGSGN